MGFLTAEEELGDELALHPAVAARPLTMLGEAVLLYPSHWYILSLTFSPIESSVK